MRASQMFGVCRERFRRDRNPQSINENVSFVMLPSRLALPSPASAGFWYQNNANPGETPEKFVVTPNTSEGAKWTFATTGSFRAWRRLDANKAGHGNECSMLLVHDHRRPTSEIYVRCIVGINLPPVDAESTLPVFSLHDVLTQKRELLITAERRAMSMVIKVEYEDKNGVARSIRTEGIPHTVNGLASYSYDIRVGLHGLDESAKPFLQVIRPDSKFSYVSYLEGAPGSGYGDMAGAKSLCWCSDRVDGMIPAGDLRPSRLGIGNLIKEALP